MATMEVELTFPAALKDEAIIYRMGHDYKVVPRIIEASFSAESGWALLRLDGEEDELERLLAYLAGLGVIVDRRG